jgi:hypothetical protein
MGLPLCAAHAAVLVVTAYVSPWDIYLSENTCFNIKLLQGKNECLYVTRKLS